MVIPNNVSSVNSENVIDQRQGVSPIGTTSPNSSGAANTNSSYGVGAYTTGTTDQSAVSTYTVQDSDFQGVAKFNSGSTVNVTLNSRVKTNFNCYIINLGTGAVTVTPNSGTVNGVASFTALQGSTVQVFFDGANWTALAFQGSGGSGTVSLTVNGYEVAGNGRILQWGHIVVDINGGSVPVTFPLAFPNACFNVSVTTSSPTDRITFVVDGTVTTTGFTISNNGSSGFAYWTAIGW